ncbi:glycoside hydrolase [Abortiporus biennis]|nr:glycoside hydrolase [Abortiporus biennis]
MLGGRRSLFALCISAGLFLLFLTIRQHDLSFQRPFGYPHDDFPDHPPPPPFDRPYPPPFHRPPPPGHKPPHSSPATFWGTRANDVREAFLHAYRGYINHAFPHDELLSLSNGHVDNFNGWGVTLIDGLDTMWIMGLHDEFAQTIPFVANMTFYLDESSYAPFFETVIRYLGGLLSAYALSHEPVLLSRADDLGRMLLPAFNTTHGLPMFAVQTVSGKTRFGWAVGTVLWSEALSCQMEYKYLAHLTGRHEYFDKVERIMDVMIDAPVQNGIFPTKWNMNTATPSNTQFSVGAFADSAHEYFLKQWLMTSKSEKKAYDLYILVANAILKELLYISPTRQLLYVTDTNNGIPSHTFEHLSCFLPGLLTLGAHTIPSHLLTPEERQQHQWAAEGLGHTCHLLYADHPSGLAPDEVFFDRAPASGDDSTSKEFKEGRWLEHLRDWEQKGKPGGIPPGLADAPPVVNERRDYNTRKSSYLLRPETVESFYLLWRTTGDEKWRERGWKVFEAIQRETRTETGYASVSDVERSPSPQRDEMPSFFMAETLKYLFLLFTDEDIVPLDQWVFNTEAHPLPVFEWEKWEKEKYAIRG